MAQLGQTLNPNEMEPGRPGFEVIPIGWYHMHIIENASEVNKQNTGELLKVTWEVQEGDHEKARVFDNINYLHEKPIVQKIGQGMVKNICDAIGYTDHLSDADVLMFQSCWVKVGIEPASGIYAEKNKILDVKKYDPAGPPVAAKPAAATAGKPVNGTKPAATTKPAAGKQAAAQPPGAGTRPWKRKAG